MDCCLLLIHHINSATFERRFFPKVIKVTFDNFGANNLATASINRKRVSGSVARK